MPTVYFPVSKAQVTFLDSPSKLKGFVAGIGSGKSYVGAYDLLKRAKAGRLYSVVAPTYTMLRDSSFRSFDEIAEKLQLYAAPVNHSQFRCKIRCFGGGIADVVFRTGDEPERLRGPNLSGSWLDEASLLSEEVYHIVLGRLREGGEQGWLDCTFTPKGRGHWTYKVFVREKKEGTLLVKCKTQDNPFISEDYIKAVEESYVGLRSLQELGGEFVEIEGAEWPGDWFESIWFQRWPQQYQCRVMALDPSKGKDAKKGDYSALVRLTVDLLGNCYIDADLLRMNTKKLVDTVLDVQSRYNADAVAIETNQFQELLAQDISESAEARGMLIPIVEINNHVNKEVRIRRLTPYLSRGRLMFKEGSPGVEMLVEQLRDFPEGEHDDGPDALEMAIRTASQLLTEGSRDQAEFLEV